MTVIIANALNNNKFTQYSIVFMISVIICHDNQLRGSAPVQSAERISSCPVEPNLIQLFLPASGQDPTAQGDPLDTAPVLQKEIHAGGKGRGAAVPGLCLELR